VEKIFLTTDSGVAATINLGSRLRDLKGFCLISGDCHAGGGAR